MNWQAWTKMLVLVSLCAAELAQAALATQTPVVGLGVSMAAFTGMVFTAQRIPQLSLMAVLFSVYILRGAFFVFFNHLSFGHFIPVSSCLLGVYCTHTDFSRWEFPRQWKLPLVLWALVLAFSWPVVFLRELDFAPFLTAYRGLWNNGNSVQTEFAALWVARTAVIEGVGLLWLEFLCRTFRGADRRRFGPWILLPLAASFGLSGLVALYQGFYDLTFWNLERWIIVRRAVGLMLDGNGLGICAAFWMAGFFVLGLGNPHGVRRTGYFGLALISLLVLISSASNGAFVMAGFPGAVIGWFVWRGAGLAPQRRWVTRGVGLVCVVGVVWGVSHSTEVTNQWERFMVLIPSQATFSPGEILQAQLRDRPFFALLSFKMMAEAPLSGMGMASFHTLANDYGRKYGMADHLPFDSALNWYLQQMTEYGLIGSVGWIAWIVVCIRTALLAPVAGGQGVQTRTLQAVVLGFGVASCFNVTAKNPEVVLTFWTFLFWLSGFVFHPAPSTPSARSEPAQTTWLFLIGIALIYALAQTYTSMTQLRVPYRASMADWDYEYGFSAWTTDPQIGSFRWIGGKAVTVLPVAGEILRFKISTPGQNQSQVQVKIWRDQDLVVDVQLSDSEPVLCEIALEPGKPRTVLQFAVSRTWQLGVYNPLVLPTARLAIGPWQFLSAQDAEQNG